MRRKLFKSLLMLLPIAAALQAQLPTQRIPWVKVETLAGASIALPEVLRGKVGVLVIGFSRGSQQGVTEWGRKLAADYRDSPTVLYYEMPMLAAVPRFMRGVVVRQMRSSVPERAWARFAPLTEDEKTWRTLTHFAVEDDAYVLLVDGGGNVRWQTAGAPTETAYTALKRQVEAASSQTASTATAQQP